MTAKEEVEDTDCIESRSLFTSLIGSMRDNNDNGIIIISGLMDMHIDVAAGCGCSVVDTIVYSKGDFQCSLRMHQHTHVVIVFQLNKRIIILTSDYSKLISLNTTGLYCKQHHDTLLG